MVKMRREQEIIFDNTVYSNRVFELDEFSLGLDRRIDLEDNNPYKIPVMVNSGGLLYLPDHSKTRTKLSTLMEDNNYGLRAWSIRKLLVDESFPDHLVLGEIGDENSTYYVEDYGRCWLTWLTGEMRLQEALPELREVMMHDLSEEMRRQAIESISKLNGRKVADALCEKLGG